jgi:hypothetical protein
MTQSTITNEWVGGVKTFTPPFRNKPVDWRRGWAKKFRAFGLYFYISNCRMKKRPIRDLMYSGAAENHVVNNKRKLYERQGGRCPHCNQPVDYDNMELHHILPLARFPELGQSIRNGILLCHRCHKEVHCNPYKNIRMMEAKAEELGIDLTERYKTGAVESEQECAPNDE